MKTTYLIYKQVNGRRQLATATQEEWDAILKKNKGLPMEKRRLFEKSCFNDGDNLDCMYIETSYEEYKRWHSLDVMHERKRKTNNAYTTLALDAPITDTELNSMHETIPGDFDLEQVVSDRVLLDELKKALETWKPWASELLAIYLDGNSRSCTTLLCKVYRLQERAVRYRKAQFEKFVINFLQ